MTKFFTVEQIIEIHDAFLEDCGGLPGIRDQGLLISAIGMPRASMFGKYLHHTIYDKAAAYFFHIIQNHPFNDGNKRTGALATILFLEENGVEIAFSDNNYEEFVITVAQGQKNKEEIAYFLKHGKESKTQPKTR
jgi:death on curing protein